ncbi:MAG: hypothetical protein F4039_00030 [Gammaproteobacteria bacterium]|nr:hypothetical protein [Gammaproteobacteria bacterium]MYF53123.1 hypothetical protein [Gammaproteobacteria bacterium]MYK42469.1 hypothetical protein [Gammaproteobacteria bacterium]
MKWYSWLWIIVRFTLFCVLWYCLTSLVLGIVLGIVWLVDGNYSDIHDTGHLITSISQSDDLMWLGVIALVVGICLSGWQHFRFYKRRFGTTVEPNTS